VARRTKWLGSIGIVAVLAAVAGGGLATGASARSKAPTQALPVSAPVTSATFSFDATVSGLTKGGGPMTVTGTGQVDLAGDAVSVAVDLPASVAALLPGGSASPEVVNAVLSGGTVYLEVPGLAGLTGAPWISLALPAGVVSGIPRGFSVAAAALGDVNEIVSLAKAHHARITSLGSSTVDDTAVSGEQIGARLAGLRVTAKLWVDGSGRLVQAVVGATRGSGTGGFAISATVDLADYGAAVTVTVPSPSQVRAIPLSLVEQFLGGLLHGAHLGATHKRVA